MTKSGFMVGLGATEEEVGMGYGREILTVSQYSRPSVSRYPGRRFIIPGA